jgi:hypothetical protein
MFQSTGERYFIDGNRIPYFFDGHNRTMALFFDLEHGLTDRIEVNAQVPVFDITFNDFADDRSSAGLGDVRVGLRYSVLQGPLVATVGARIKFPTGEFINDAEIVPVGEGQYDFEIRGELAHSFWPNPGYVSGLIGYRIRTKNEEINIDFGDELIWSIEGGYNVTSKIMLKGLFWGLYGFESTSFGLPLSSLRREAVYVEPGVVYAIDRSRGIEFTVPITLRGRNWPAGPVLNIGFYQRF